VIAGGFGTLSAFISSSRLMLGGTEGIRRATAPGGSTRAAASQVYGRQGRENRKEPLYDLERCFK
jgi:hypothetical protein